MLQDIIDKPNEIEWVSNSNQSMYDREIDSYFLGKEEGVEEFKQKFRTIFHRNLKKSYHDTSKVLSQIEKIGVEIQSTHLNIKNINSFRVKIAITESDKLLKNMGSIYESLFSIEEKVRKKNYDLRFSIIKADENFSEACLISDGFNLKHKSKIKSRLNAKRARTT